MKPTISEVREIISLFLNSELQDLRLEIGDVRVAVSRNGGTGAAMSAPAFSAPASAVTAPAPAPAPAAAEPVAAAPQTEAVQAQENWVAITAPSLGVFYRRPSPDQPPFVQEGDELEENAPVCLIEVMKMYNRVSAPCKGRIAKILVEDGKMVEFGQTLMYVEPA